MTMPRECKCAAFPCIHDKLPHLPKATVFTRPEKERIKTTLDFFSQKPQVRDSSDAREVRER